MDVTQVQWTTKNSSMPSAFSSTMSRLLSPKMPRGLPELPESTERNSMKPIGGESAAFFDFFTAS